MFETKRKDWYFIYLASLVFFLSLIVSMWDFILIQNMDFGIINVLGLILFFIGLTMFNWKENSGKTLFTGLENSARA